MERGEGKGQQHVGVMSRLGKHLVQILEGTGMVSMGWRVWCVVPHGHTDLVGREKGGNEFGVCTSLGKARHMRKCMSVGLVLAESVFRK